MTAVFILEAVSVPRSSSLILFQREVARLRPRTGCRTGPPAQEGGQVLLQEEDRTAQQGQALRQARQLQPRHAHPVCRAFNFQRLWALLLNPYFNYYLTLLLNVVPFVHHTIHLIDNKLTFVRCSYSLDVELSKDVVSKSAIKKPVRFGLPDLLPLH